MIHLHAHWNDGLLHLWGEKPPEEADPDTEARPSTPSRTTSSETGAAREKAIEHPYAVGENHLRHSLGDAFDSLLISGAKRGSLVLRLPLVDGAPVPSTGRDGSTPSRRCPRLRPCLLPCITFKSADAMDLLTAAPRPAEESFRLADSFRYWSRAADLVLELLARQRFVPAIHRGVHGGYHGYWLVVVDDEDTRNRLRDLIASMPPVCRSAESGRDPLEASELVEGFLWTTVDALVRRCLKGDELARAVLERTRESSSPQIYWLRALVGPDPRLHAPPEDREMIYRTVRDWLDRGRCVDLERSFRTCFRLREPPAGAPGDPWMLTLHIQSLHDPSLIVEGGDVLDQAATHPSILQGPFENVAERFRTDVAQAARHFAPLANGLERSTPSQCRLSHEEAYTFLREAAPLLESEGYGVEVPKWWRQHKPRLRLWLDLQPLREAEDAGRSSLALDSLVAYNWRVALGDESLSLEEISRLAAETRPLVCHHGKWLEVQPVDLKTAVAFLERNPGGRMTVFDALRRCYRADDLETGIPVAGLHSSGWIESLLNANASRDHVEHLAPPKDFRGTLRPYQLRGLSWLAFLSRLGLGGCLADDMGLGKTIQMIALWLYERQDQPSPGPTLLIVPMSLVGNWQREIARFAPTLRTMIHHGLDRLTGEALVKEARHYDVVISTYGLIHRDRAPVAAVDWYRIALDEAQNIKNPAAKQSSAIRSLRAVHRVALTGTPVENRLSELWSILDFLNPAYLGGGAEFRQRFAVPIERYHDTDRAQRLRQLIQPFVLRRRKNDPSVCVDLPPKMEMKVFCNLTREQAALYEAIVSEMLDRIEDSGGIRRRGLILASLIKLKQICNHPVQFLRDGTDLAHRSGKCERLVEMLEVVLAEGDRALIFTQFRKMGELLQQLLRDRLNQEALLLHGGVTRIRRDDMIQRFQRKEGDTPLFILSLKAGGYGLNLTAANHVFHFDRWWNPAVEDQATDRVHRMGQDKRVQVHKYVCVGTLEERIDAMLEKKRGLAEKIMGGGEDWLTELSTEKLREVFALSRDAVAENG